MADRTSMGRSLVIGALLGVLVVAVALGALFLGLDWTTGGGAGDVPSNVLVICVTKDVDGAYVGGVMFTIAADGATEIVDPYEQVTIPGTTYDRLRDAYAFGGGTAVAAAYSEAAGEAPGAWVVLPADEWTMLVDDAGGASIDVPTDVNIFMDDVLYPIGEGPQTVSGDELAALAVAAADREADYSATLDRGVVEALLGAVEESWGTVVEAVETGDASSSAGSTALGEFGTRAGL